MMKTAMSWKALAVSACVIAASSFVVGGQMALAQEPARAAMTASQQAEATRVIEVRLSKAALDRRAAGETEPWSDYRIPTDSGLFGRPSGAGGESLFDDVDASGRTRLDDLLPSKNALVAMHDLDLSEADARSLTISAWGQPVQAGHRVVVSVKASGLQDVSGKVVSAEVIADSVARAAVSRLAECYEFRRASFARLVESQKQSVISAEAAARWQKETRERIAALSGRGDNSVEALRAAVQRFDESVEQLRLESAGLTARREASERGIAGMEASAYDLLMSELRIAEAEKKGQLRSAEERAVKLGQALELAIELNDKAESIASTLKEGEYAADDLREAQARLETLPASPEIVIVEKK